MWRVASTSRAAQRLFSMAGEQQPSTWTSSSFQIVTDFIPLPEGWENRSPLIARKGKLSFHHFDPVAQALSKIERGHSQDVQDVREMIAHGLVDPPNVLSQFESIEPDLYRFPAIDPASFRKAVEDLLSET
jgi:hypothetical protein